MQDGARCHTASNTMEYLISANVTVLEWPAQSSDLNPIENVWSVIKGVLYERRSEIKTKLDVWNIASDEFFNNEIILEMIPRLYASMSRRCFMVVASEGRAIPY
jgi:transposase